MKKQILMILLIAGFGVSCASTGGPTSEADDAETMAVVWSCVAFGILGIECED